MNDRSQPYRTRSGRLLTERELDELVVEAERGYDMDELTRRRGRPRMGKTPAVVVPVRLHTEIHAAVKARAAEESTSVSDLIRRALTTYLAAAPPNTAEARTKSGRLLSEFDLSDLASEAEAGYDLALQTAPSHRPARAQAVPVRLPPELKTAVERRAEQDATSVSDVIRSALRAYLDDPDDDPDPDPPTSATTVKRRRSGGRPTEADTCRDYVCFHG